MVPGAWELVTPPTGEIVTLDEAKVQLRQSVDDKGENDRITSLIAAAVDWVENLTRKLLLTQTWRLWLNTFPIFCDEDESDFYDQYAIRLPFAPVQSVTQILYYDGSNAQKTLDPATYQTDLVGVPGRILPAFGSLWPVTYPRYKAVQVDFTAGYGDDASSVPEAFKNAIKLHVQGAYDGVDNSQAIENLLQKYTTVAF